MSKAPSIRVYRADTGQLCEVDLHPTATYVDSRFFFSTHYLLSLPFYVTSVLQLKTALAQITGELWSLY